MKYKEQITQNRLREVRTQIGLTQLRVVNLLGWKSADRLSHWEKGVSVPSIANLFRLSTLYGTHPYNLYPELFRKAQQETEAALTNWNDLNS